MQCSTASDIRCICIHIRYTYVCVSVGGVPDTPCCTACLCRPPPTAAHRTHTPPTPTCALTHTHLQCLLVPHHRLDGVGAVGARKGLDARLAPSNDRHGGHVGGEVLVHLHTSEQQESNKLSIEMGMRDS